MAEELKLVEDFDMTMIEDFFLPLDRQGPGSEEVTRLALSFAGNLSPESKIADIGCGAGGQTLTLAAHTEGHIVAVDLLSRMIAKLNERMKQHGFSNRVTGITGSMTELPFKENEFDLLWAEGSIYNIGYERGLREWKKFMKPGGMIAVSEVSWLTPTRPEEIDRFWTFNYGEIDLVSNKVKQMEQAGYTPVAHFVLPEYCWTENFFEPMRKHAESFLQKYGYSKVARDFAKRELDESRIYEQYKSYYGYVFYIGIKNKQVKE